MADIAPIQPVGAQIQPPNPQQGLNAYSGILGIQQQKQQLQLGQAQVTIAQQNAKENQGIAQLLSDPKNLLDDQGNPLPDAQARIMRVAPTTGSQKYQQVMDAAKAKVGFQSDLANLSDKIRGQVGSVLSADGAGNASREDTIAHLTQLGQDNPQAWPVITRTIAHLPPEPHMTGDKQQDQQALQQHMQQLNQYRVGFGRAVTGPAGAAGYNDVSTTAVPSGGQINMLQTTKAGNISKAGGIPMTLGPTDQPGYKGQVAAATTAATGAGDVDNQTLGNAMNAAAKSGTVIDLSKKVRELAAQIRTGKLTGEFADNLTLLQQHDPGATARQLMEKYAANLKTAVESTGSTDAERAQIGSGFPTPKTMGPDALEEAAGYAEGHGRLAQERGTNAAKYVQQHGTQGLAVNDNEFMKGKSPLTYAPKTTSGEGSRVRVKSPDGKTGTIPAGRLAAYKAQGYTEAP